mgnify:FL=1
MTRLIPMALAAGWMVLPICVLRWLLQRCPRKYLVLLWVPVAMRLCLPLQIQSTVSLVPTALSRMSYEPSQRFLFLWLAGTGCVLACGGFRLLRLKRRLGEAVHLRGNLWLCDHLPGAFVMGLLHPKINIPSDLQPEAMALVIAHERAHIRRGDVLWKGIAYVLLSIYWFHPLLWLAYLLFCRDVELACDQAATARLSRAARREYAQALVSCAAPAAPVPGFGSHLLKERIHTILDDRKPPRWAVPAFLVAFLLLAACFMTNAKPRYSPQVTAAVGQFLEELAAVNK